MNGLESEDCIAEIFGMDKVLHGISVGIDAQRQENQMSYTNPGKHYFGELNNAEINEKVRRVQRHLRARASNTKRL